MVGQFQKDKGGHALKISFVILSFVILTPLLSILLLQADGPEFGIGLLSYLLSTERILSLIMIYFAIWVIPRQVWPWVTKHFDTRQQIMTNELAVRDRMRERQLDLLIELLERTAACPALLQYIADAVGAKATGQKKDVEL